MRDLVNGFTTPHNSHHQHFSPQEGYRVLDY